MNKIARGYLIANYTIHDQDKYQEYVRVVIPLLAKYGGKMLIGDANRTALEGNPELLIVVVEFENIEIAQHFYSSREYTELKHLRTASSVGWVAIATEFVMASG